MNLIWSEVTYKEIEEIKKEEYIVILPLGSIEVHGPHLPLGSDGI
ncbi:creatininase family protein, partial [archaeon]